MAIQTHHRIQCDGPDCQAQTAYHDDVSMAEDNAHAAGWHSRMPGKFSSEFEWHCPACKDKVNLGPENHGRWADDKR